MGWLQSGRMNVWQSLKPGNFSSLACDMAKQGEIFLVA